MDTHNNYSLDSFSYCDCLGNILFSQTDFKKKIKDIESKVQNHEKFVQILEKRALSALEEEFNGSIRQKIKTANEH